MKKFIGKLVSLSLVAAMLLVMPGCGASDESGSVSNEQSDTSNVQSDTSNEQSNASGEKIVNIGITDSLGAINPLTIDQTWVNKYAVGLEFLPLVELNSEMNFQSMLADSVTTEDNMN